MGAFLLKEKGTKITTALFTPAELNSVTMS
jgi:hypothetical protein